MSTPYQRGAAFEHRVKAELEEAGYFVVRQPVSRSPFDLLALRLRDGTLPLSGLRPEAGHNGAPILIQCKLRGRLLTAERAALVDLSCRLCAEPVLAFTVKERGAVHYVLLAYGDKSWSP